MNFLELQAKFTKKHLDNRTIWASGWADNKEALNDWYKTVYNKAVQDRSIQQIMKSAKTLVTMSWNEWTLPSDFKSPVKLYWKSWTYAEIDDEVSPYRYQRTSTGNKIIFDETPTNAVYIEYIAKHVEMNADTDEITIPDDFEDDVINYALIEYFRNQRDWGNVWNSLEYAEWKIKETIDNFWLE